MARKAASGSKKAHKPKPASKAWIDRAWAIGKMEREAKLMQR